MVRGLILECALEVSSKPVTGALEGLDFSTQPGDTRLDGFLFHLEGRDLSVARRNRRVGAGQLAGEAVTIGVGGGSAPRDVR